jgi:hypothetical protein
LPYLEILQLLLHLWLSLQLPLQRRTPAPGLLKLLGPLLQFPQVLLHCCCI